MNKIVSKRNLKIVEKGRKLLVGYLLAGYPGKESFLRVVAKCEEAGVDIFEIGFPSSDPAYDGEVIRNAHQIVDNSICSDEDYWELIRKTVRQPIWVMGYKKDLIDTGFYKVLAKKGLADALVIPDISFEERKKLGEEVGVFGVDIIGFVNPEMEDSNIEECFSSTPIVYQQLYSGLTGMPVVSDDFKDVLDKARKYGNTKVFAGFGISTPQRVSQLLGCGFDGVIIGTAMIKKLNDSEEELFNFIKELTAAVEKAGESDEIYRDL